MKLFRNRKRSGDVLRCSFCNKSQRYVRKLITGPAVQICDECVAICVETIEEDIVNARIARSGKRSSGCVVCNNETQPDGQIDLGVWGWACQRCAEEVRDALLWWSQKHDGAAG